MKLLPSPLNSFLRPARLCCFSLVLAMLALPAASQTPVTNGLALWLDASQLSGLADGQQVNTWTDLSGQNNHALRQSGSSSGYPQYKISQVNGKPVVRFNSANGNTGDYYKFNRISSIRTVFWVVKENAGTSDGHFLLGDDSSYDFHRASANGPLWEAANSWSSANIWNGTTRLMGTVVNGTTTAIPAGQFQLISLVTAGNVQANQITQDRVYHGSWQGDIAEILIYTVALSANQEAAVGSYLAAKYGLTTAYSPPAPTGLGATPSSKAILLNWTGSTGATGYKVKRSGTSGSGYAMIGTASGTNYTDKSVVTGNTCYYVVSATNSAGESADSAQVNVTAVVSTAKDMLSFDFGPLGIALITGTNITLAVTYGTAVTNLAPTYMVSPFASASPLTGTSRDFSAPQAYIVTAEDLSTKLYIVTVTIGAPPTARTWSGSGSNDSWTTATNWTGGTAPSAGDGLVFAGATRLSNTNDLPLNTVFQGVTFSAVAGGFVLNGNGLVLSGDVVDSATVAQRVNLSLGLGTAGRVFSVVTNGQLLVSQPISGNQGITKEGPGTLTLTAAGAYSGGTWVNTGILRLAPSGIGSPVSGMLYWLDASDSTTLTMDAANNVSQWSDKSGNSRHFTQAITTKQPLLVTGALGGKPVVRFDGVSDRLVLGSSTSPQTVFIVNKVITGGGLRGIWGQNQADTGIRLASDTAWQTTGNVNDFSNPSGSVMYINGLVASTFTSGSAHLLEVVRASSVAFPATGVGDYFNDGGRPLGGDIAEVLVYGRMLTAAERQQVESYLMAKWLGGSGSAMDLLPTSTA
ncbi:MAG: autotransporter-associated beta strand repeat-containing protein, partial [Verrucomicrobia bacterium]|nr:autotransporter-associated beta strand repeat-containing protein [Verrucomicrobiota bacterium]